MYDDTFLANKQRRAKAKFSYHPQAEDELELADGVEVIVLGVVEEGWWRGKVGQKEGVFPSNFVEEITEESEPPVHNDRPAPVPPTETVDHTLAPSMLFIEHFLICICLLGHKLIVIDSVVSIILLRGTVLKYM